MNKNRLRNLFEKGILILGALVFLVNCQKEEDILNPDSQTKAKGGFKISIVDGHQVAQNKHLTTKLERIKNARNQGDITSQKDVHDIEHGFTINTERVKYIEKDDGYHSYTFPILRDVDNGLLENLVFSSQDDGTYDTFVVTYDLTIDQQGDLLEGLDVDLQGKVTKTQVNDLGLPTDLMGKVTADCVLIVTEYCSCGQHPNSDGNYLGCSSSCYSTSSAEHCTGGAISNNDPDGNPPNTDTDTSGGHQEGGGEGTGGATSPTCTRNCIDEACSSTEALNNLTNSLNLPPALAACLEGDDKCEQVTALAEFSQHNPDDLEFAQITAQALCNDSELQVIDVLGIVPQMEDSPCQAKVIYKALFVDSSFTNTFKEALIKPNNWHINFKDLDTGEGEPPMQNNTGARVLPSIETHPDYGRTVILEFNNDHLNQATNLGYINTLYHEMLHAYILHLHLKGELLNVYPQYLDLNTAMQNFLSDLENETLGIIYEKEMHNIYVDFIDLLANSLLQYCLDNNITGVNLNYAKKLVWGGLNGNDIFYNNLTTEQQIDAQALLAYENSNISANAKGPKTCN